MQVGCVALPQDFTCPLSLDETGQFDWTSSSLHLSCLTGQARSTGFFETLSLESLTRLGTPSLESLTPLTPTLPQTFPLDPKPERNQHRKTRTVTTRSAVELQCGGGCAGVLGRCGVTPVQWGLSSLPIHHENLPLREVFFVYWVSDPSSVRVGALVVLSCAFESDRPSWRQWVRRCSGKRTPSSRWPSSFLVCPEAHKLDNSLRARKR